ncbi:MAG: GDP-L-fucose synthase [Patescibacteria group bacterium]
MKQNSKIYVAGHTGMVGSAVVRKLKKDGYANLLVRTRGELNLIRQSAVEDFFKEEQPEYVILAAARVGGITANIESPADFLFENLEIQNNIIWNAHLSGVKKLLFLGSSCIYPRNCPQPMKEEYLLDGKPEPTNEGYSLAKISGLKLCEKIYEQYGKIFISCMPTNIYGERDNFDIKSSHVIPSLMQRMHKARLNNEKSVLVWGSGEARREFLFVDDLADAIVWLMNNYNDKQFINIGTGMDISIKELAFLIKKAVGYDGEIVFDKSKPEGMPRKLLDVTKINSIGWQYAIELNEGLEKTYKWYVGKEIKA